MIFKLSRTKAKLYNVKQERGKIKDEFAFFIGGGIQLLRRKGSLVATVSVCFLKCNGPYTFSLGGTTLSIP